MSSLVFLRIVIVSVRFHLLSVSISVLAMLGWRQLVFSAFSAALPKCAFEKCVCFYPHVCVCPGSLLL